MSLRSSIDLSVPSYSDPSADLVTDRDALIGPLITDALANTDAIIERDESSKERNERLDEIRDLLSLYHADQATIEKAATLASSVQWRVKVFYT